MVYIVQHHDEHVRVVALPAAVPFPSAKAPTWPTKPTTPWALGAFTLNTPRPQCQATSSVSVTDRTTLCWVLMSCEVSQALCLAWIGSGRGSGAYFSHIQRERGGGRGD